MPFNAQRSHQRCDHSSAQANPLESLKAFLVVAPWLGRAVLGCLLTLAAGCGQSSDSPSAYPNRLIELIVPWAAGGGTDRVARYVAHALQQELGQPVVVVNRTGGSGAVGHSAGAFATPDGYTLTMATFELSTMRAMHISELTWRDFEPVAQVNADAATIIVRQDAPWKTLPELLTAIRESPRKLKMSGTATGGAWDLARAGLLLAAGIAPNQVIWAPTQGSAPALVELLGGHVDVVCCSAPEAAAQLESGQARVLAVLGPERLKDFPDYPTAREQGIEYEAVGWRGIMVPPKTPPAVVLRLSGALEQIVQSEGFHDFMRKNGFAIALRGPAEFRAFLDAEEAKWRAVIENAGYATLGENHDPGPRAVPLVLLLVLLGALGVELWTTAAREAAIPVAPGERGWSRERWRAAWLVVGLGVYLVVMPWAGFVVSTWPFAFALMWWLGTRWWQAAVVSVLLVGAVQLLFVTLFKVQLP